MITPAELERHLKKARVIELEEIWIPRIVGRDSLEERTAKGDISISQIGLDAMSQEDKDQVIRMFNRIQSGKGLNVKMVKSAHEIIPKYAKELIAIMAERAKLKEQTR